MASLDRLALAASLAAFAIATPAAAQDDMAPPPGQERVNMVIAYSEDECPEPTDANEIVVCEILVEADRYRIPSNLRQSNSPEGTAWTERVESIRYIGEFGTMSCSPAGAGGITGCTQAMIDVAYAERDQSDAVRFSQLIEEARQERLSTIDEDAAEMQERVEQIEREYLERLERERSAPLPGENELPATITTSEPETEGPGE
ncbi:hypothetical protein CD351_01820 [Erythrobacter sp. KY5]|uniref:hypothetical protein n=1 Tax=Erythrobacter sp. KY5 TaxID=2011159 RepID=UPI000DBF0735|nr:hypothetical protein [Erythrobacter sp. KY5]AWW73158.1 hypothetical protein CD351_01820 [Erythrobacter sp. KY5]